MSGDLTNGEGKSTMKNCVLGGMKMEDNLMTTELSEGFGEGAVDLSRYTAKTFLLMFLGLLVTFATAFFFGYTYTGLSLMVRGVYATGGYLFLILTVAELAVVIGLTALLHKISAAVAVGSFLLYSALTGVTFSTLLWTFDLEVMIFAFGLTALYFGGMAIFACLTRVDLSSLRPILVGGLIFLLAANLVMLFVPMVDIVDQVLCSIGVVIFLGYTAYDTQKMRALYFSFTDEEMRKKASVYFALELYLDFVNLFLYILKLLGKSKKRK